MKTFKKTGFVTKAAIIVIGLMIAVAASSCKVGYQGRKYGLLSMQLGKAATVSTVVPALAFSSYRLSFSGPEPMADIDVTESNPVVVLPVGVWQITVQAMNALSLPVAEGAAVNVVITEQGATSVLVTVYPIASGVPGTIDVTVTWPLDVVVMSSIDVTLDSVAVDPGTVTTTPTSVQYVESRDAGEYRLDITLTYPGTPLVVTEMIHVYGNLTSEATIALTEADFNAPPAAPSGLFALATASSIDLAWSDNSSVENGFVLERTEVSGDFGDASAISIPLGPDVTSYSDTTVATDVVYYYRVGAQNALGISYSAEIGASISGSALLTILAQSPTDNEITFDQAGDIVLPSTATMTVGTVDTYDTYEWNLDGVVVGTASDILIDGTVTALGVHRLTVIAESAGSFFSDTLRFTVENEVTPPAFVVDHTSRDITQIPTAWIDTVKTMVLHHTGQSHGQQIPHGLENLELADPTYDAAISTTDIPVVTGALRVTRGQLSAFNDWYFLIGPDSYWQTEDGKDFTRRTLDYHALNGDTIDVSLHTLSYYISDWTSADVEDYLASMSALELEYPNVVFVYLTGPASSTGEFGYQRWLRNERIRQYCALNNKVLFDFADLETWSADGTTQATYFHAGSGLDIPVEHPDWLSLPFYDDGHINEAATTMKAQAMWWLLARIAGWEGL